MTQKSKEYAKRKGVKIRRVLLQAASPRTKIIECFLEGNGHLFVGTATKGQIGTVCSYLKRQGVEVEYIEGVILGLGIPYAFVTPQEWQKGLFTITDGDGKQQSVNAAKRLFPQAVGELKLKKHHNRADALLIARNGLERRAG